MKLVDADTKIIVQFRKSSFWGTEDFVPQTRYQGFTPGPYWGTPAPDPLICITGALYVCSHVRQS